MSLDALFGAETRFSTLGVVQRAATGHAVPATYPISAGVSFDTRI